MGLRSVDEIEGCNVRGTGVHPFTMRDIDERGMRTVMHEAIRYASAARPGFIFLRHGRRRSAARLPASELPFRGGITYREAHLAMEMSAIPEA